MKLWNFSILCKIFGSVQRMAIYTQADGNKVRWIWPGSLHHQGGAICVDGDNLPPEKVSARRNPMDTTRAALQFDLLCRAGELVDGTHKPCQF